MKGTLVTQLQLNLHQAAASCTNGASVSIPSSPFQKLLDSEANVLPLASDGDDKDLILSQDFFCTPDYITPDNQNLLTSFDCNKENIPCHKSPEKLNTVEIKKRRQDGSFCNPLSPPLEMVLLEMVRNKFWTLR